MTKKRFTVFMPDDSDIWDNGHFLALASDPKYAKKLCRVLNALHEENEQLKNSVDILDKVRNELIDENEELKQRNTRQAKQLDRLYCLIEEKDWRALNDILDDFKRCEEQLQREWGTYGDLE